MTKMSPVKAPLGTATTNCVVVADEGVALTPLKLTALSLGVALKFVPVMVTSVPTGPLAGVKPVIFGMTVNALALVPVKVPTVTVIVPVVAPLGTRTTNFVAVADEGVVV